VPGQIGLLQATEVIKFILKKGKPLIGQFLVYHSLESDFRLFQVKKNPACPLCNEKPKIRELVDEHVECSLEARTSSAV
jgi:molybdopterin/thiamine biosynthesis adenylyltransferase